MDRFACREFVLVALCASSFPSLSLSSLREFYKSTKLGKSSKACVPSQRCVRRLSCSSVVNSSVSSLVIFSFFSVLTRSSRRSDRYSFLAPSFRRDAARFISRRDVWLQISAVCAIHGGEMSIFAVLGSVVTRLKLWSIERRKKHSG